MKEIRIHPTAIVESGVIIGPGSSVWDNVHVRHSTVIGDECIIGEKTYVAYGVSIGSRVKINAMVYIWQCCDDRGRRHDQRRHDFHQ